MTEKLPIDVLRDEFREALKQGPVVVSSPTGSGKSTQVPRWCDGRVLVVEPRRVACRSLAQRVAELEGSRLGEAVGYHVRDEQRAGSATRILFATPGVVLRIFDSIGEYGTVILDEFHERSLEVDLLLALLLRHRPGRLVVMSATLEGERVAAHVGGRHLHAAGRIHPVEVRYLPEKNLLPEGRGIENRVRHAVEASREHAGDVLGFLPGKGEIAACAGALRSAGDLEVLELHGGLTLEEQSRAFLPAGRRKVVLATNVAETSITLPGIGVVIDSGLVRQTRYHRDRGFLTLVPVAADSAEQRAGRAGRTAPGVAYRLWSESALLEKRTPPEIYRESLVPLVLAAAACGEAVGRLSFLDPPREHAVDTARQELEALGALDANGRITARGRELFGLPLDAPLGRLLVEAQARAEHAPGLLEEVIDLVSVLAVGRPLFVGPGRWEDDEEDENPATRCDAVAIIRALRRRPRGRDPRHPSVVREARSIRARLRRAYGLPQRAETTIGDKGIDRRRLAMTVLAADPRCAHVARRRGRRLAWSNGGTELELSRQSAVRSAEEVEAIAVLETRALGLGGRDTRILVTCAMPLPLAWLVEAGLGKDRLGKLVVEGTKQAPERVVARIERVYARQVLAVREQIPSGRLARQAAAELFLRGSVFPDTLKATRERLQAAALARKLASHSHGSWEEELRTLYPRGVPSPEAWVAARLEVLGVESGDDMALLAAEDLLAPDLPPRIRHDLDREFPRTLNILGVVYEVDYDPSRREATLRKLSGGQSEPPSPFYLPRFSGFRVRIEHRGSLLTLRE